MLDPREENMTAEKLYGLLKFLDGLDTKLALQASLEAVGSALSNVAGSPAQPQHQTSLANALNTLQGAVSRMNAAISPSQLLQSTQWVAKSSSVRKSLRRFEMRCRRML